MNTSYPAKALALVGSLARRPADIFSYITQIPLWGRHPTDLELPWFSYGAIEFLEHWVRPTHQVFEYGSGGSTLFFARRAAEVLAVENAPDWHTLVDRLLRERGLKSAAVELHPLADDMRATFDASSFANRIRSRQWDIVVVDCHCGFNAAPFGVIRPAALELAMAHVAPGGIIVLDDSWMFTELLWPRAGWEIIDYRGCGPARYGVTSTAIMRKVA